MAMPDDTAPPYDPWTDVRAAVNLLRSQPDPDIGTVLGLLEDSLLDVAYERDCDRRTETP